MFGIQRAQVILSKISTEQILYLIFQILQKHGMLAVGEVGKHHVWSLANTPIHLSTLTHMVELWTYID